jgi:twitching motility protein PilT
MPHVDSLLSLAHKDGADELRIGTDRAPEMFAGGAQRRLSIPKTSADTLRHLLGQLVTAEVEQALRETSRVETSHEVKDVGTFRVTLTARGDGSGIDVVFLRKKDKAATATALPPTEGRPTTGPVDAARAPAADHDRETRAIAEASPVGGAPERAGGDLTSLMRLFERAIAVGASDLHLSDRSPPAVRVDGRLRLLVDEAPTSVEALVGPALSVESRAPLDQGRSVDFALDLVASATATSGRRPRFRGNVYRTATGLAAAFRLLPADAPRLDSLTFPVPVSDLASLPNGLVVVSGPTGSGKTTTLAALAQEALRKRSIVLVTLEDPIEYTLRDGAGRAGGGHSLVRQRQVGRDVRDFATGLRDALREDPDVIVVGEMRDEESISLALTAAETGHLVLTTLHSRSAASTLERITDAYPEARHAPLRAQLADSLRAVVSQRLVPRARGEGRALAAEVLRVTPSVAASLREGKISGITSAMQSGRRDGMIPLERALAELVRGGEIADDAARAAANDLDALGSYLRG